MKEKISESLIKRIMDNIFNINNHFVREVKLPEREKADILFHAYTYISAALYEMSRSVFEIEESKFEEIFKEMLEQIKEDNAVGKSMTNERRIIINE
jgi:CRISPR/Cas system CSM-associated protein Csm2 small subunit